jgi:hypothetical protein
MYDLMNRKNSFLLVQSFFNCRRVRADEAQLRARDHALSGEGQAQEDGHHGHPEDRVSM